MHVEIHVTSGPAKGKQFIFDKPDCFLFGRAADAHISLPNDQYVSRQHFLLEISPPECKLTDLNSKNGVFVNGIRYGGRKPPKTGIKQAPNGIKEVLLKNGDEIAVGETHIKIFIQTDVNLLSKEEETRTDRTDLGLQKQIICCSLCGKDVTDEADLLAQTGRSEYVCTSCREKVPREELKKILKDALANEKARSVRKTSPGLPSIEGYHIEGEIRHGGIGTIYKAKEIKTGQFVAIKTLLSQGTNDPYKVDIFQRELNIVHQLRHKHIVRFFEYGEAEGTFYFVFEFVDGMDLAKFIHSKGGRVSVNEAAPILLGTLDGLTYAHHAKIIAQDTEGKRRIFKGIVHRNLKPQNILLAREKDLWIPKITDFGLSKSFESAGLTNITTSGDVLGTPIYWSREQITHYRYLSPATDVFSIAAVFYEMLTGSWVREGFRELFNKCKQHGELPTISDYINVIAANPPIPIRKRNPNIPEPLANVIDRALREEEVPHENINLQDVLGKLRYPDAGAFRNALLEVFKELGVPLVSEDIWEVYDDEREEDAVEGAPASAILYSIIQPAASEEVALLILDLVESTQYMLRKGDTDFRTLIGDILRRARAHSSSSDLIFLKSTGDGFLSIFNSVSAAFSLALIFLETPVHPDVHIRMALHWGSVKTGPDGDILGNEVRKVLRIEKLKMQDQLGLEVYEEILPEIDRILATKQAIKQLNDSDKGKFRPVGKFRLDGLDDACEIWVSPK